MPAFGTVHHLNVSVTDLERSEAWYTNVLGLTHGWEMEDVEGRGRKVVLLHPGEPMRIVLSRHQANDGEPFSEFRTGLDHLEFVVTQKADLHEWAERLDELGIAHSGVKELSYTENSMLTFRDPDNIQLEFFWRAQRVD